MTERPTYPKSMCCIPGCAHWSRRFPGEWLCARHWRMVPARCRRALQKVWREWGAMPHTFSEVPKGDERLRWLRFHRLDQRLWAHARRAAILRSAGL
jgi:hypothetical protein